MPYYIDGFRGGDAQFSFGTKFRFYEDFLLDAQAGAIQTDFTRSGGDSPFSTTLDQNHPGIIRSQIQNSLQLTVGGSLVPPLVKFNKLYWEGMIRITQYAGSWNLPIFGFGSTSQLNQVGWALRTDDVAPTQSIAVAGRWCPIASANAVVTSIDGGASSAFSDGSWFRLAWQWVKTRNTVEFFVAKDQGSALLVGSIAGANLPVNAFPSGNALAYAQFIKTAGPPGDVQIDYVYIDGDITRF